MTFFSTEPSVNVIAAAIILFAAIFFGFAFVSRNRRLVISRAAVAVGFLALWYVCRLEYSWTDNPVWGWGYVVFAFIAFILGLLTMRGLVFRE